MVLNLASVQSTSEQPHSPMTARDYYNELFKAGGLDNFADQYVCFRNDAQPVFFLMADSEVLKRYLVSVGGINRLPAKDRANLDKGLAFVVQYHQGVSNGRDYFDRTGPGEYTENLSLPQAPPKQPLKLTRLLRVNWQTLRYELDIEQTGVAGVLYADTGKCEAVSPDYNPHKDRTEP